MCIEVAQSDVFSQLLHALAAQRYRRGGNDRCAVRQLGALGRPRALSGDTAPISLPPRCRPDPQAAPAMTAPQVLQSTEQVLENAGSVKHPAELARMYLRQLQFVLDQGQS